MIRVIGYIRVSTDKQDLQRQKELIEAYCKENNYQLVRFIGEKISGAKVNRNGLTELLSITKNECDIIAVSELSRISRQDDIMNVIAEINQIRTNNLDLYILDTNTSIKANDTIGGLEVMQLVFMAVGNADERRKITQRMSTGRWIKIQHNHYAYMGGTIPFGFDVVPNDKYDDSVKENKDARRILVPNENEIKIVKMLYNKIISGYTLCRLAKYLIKHNISISKSGKVSKTDQHSILSKLLHNSIYNGKRRYKGNTYSIDKIITDEVFNKAMKALEDNKTYISYVNKERINILKGIVKCSCGKSLYMIDTSNRHYYRCINKKDILGNVRCTNSGINYNSVVKAIWAVFRLSAYTDDFKAKTSDRESEIKTEIELTGKGLNEDKKRIEQLESELRIIENNMFTVTNQKLISSMEKRYTDIENEISSIRQKIVNKKGEIKSLDEALKQLNEISKDDLLNNMDDTLKSEILHKAIKEAVWHSHKMSNGFLIVTFKNGVQKIMMIRAHYKHKFIYELPQTFDFNAANKKVVVTYYDGKQLNPDGGLNFSYGFKTYQEEYNFDEVLIEFENELPKWEIEKKIEHYFGKKK